MVLNRSAVIVKPLRPYLDWAKMDDAEGFAESVFENLRGESRTCISSLNTKNLRRSRRCWRSFGQSCLRPMLEGWVRDEAFWPKDRTLGMFHEWFEIQMCSIVQDLDSDTPLELI